uniref:Arginine kinase n=1 Tax=Chilo partellus TaxID=236792 RepID=A0A5J6DQQ8_9NEOP|nr:Arginine kinase [Chilo partellus]
MERPQRTRVETTNSPAGSRFPRVSTSPQFLGGCLSVFLKPLW